MKRKKYLLLLTPKGLRVIFVLYSLIWLYSNFPPAGTLRFFLDYLAPQTILRRAPSLTTLDLSTIDWFLLKDLASVFIDELPDHISPKNVPLGDIYLRNRRMYGREGIHHWRYRILSNERYRGIMGKFFTRIIMELSDKNTDYLFGEIEFRTQSPKRDLQARLRARQLTPGFRFIKGQPKETSLYEPLISMALYILTQFPSLSQEELQRSLFQLDGIYQFYNSLHPQKAFGINRSPQLSIPYAYLIIFSSFVDDVHISYLDQLLGYLSQFPDPYSRQSIRAILRAMGYHYKGRYLNKKDLPALKRNLYDSGADLRFSKTLLRVFSKWVKEANQAELSHYRNDFANFSIGVIPVWNRLQQLDEEWYHENHVDPNMVREVGEMIYELLLWPGMDIEQWLQEKRKDHREALTEIISISLFTYWEIYQSALSVSFPIDLAIMDDRGKFLGTQKRIGNAVKRHLPDHNEYIVQVLKDQGLPSGFDFFDLSLLKLSDRERRMYFLDQFEQEIKLFIHAFGISQRQSSVMDNQL